MRKMFTEKGWKGEFSKKPFSRFFSENVEDQHCFRQTSYRHVVLHVLKRTKEKSSCVQKFCNR